jgi:hypothetical protein
MRRKERCDFGSHPWWLSSRYVSNGESMLGIQLRRAAGRVFMSLRGRAALSLESEPKRARLVGDGTISVSSSSSGQVYFDLEVSL